ncbi:MAG: aspartate/glutamate racemase family protein [Rubrivivax sp.]|jgi:Asp/Glu/hydantoin racemase
MSDPLLLVLNPNSTRAVTDHIATAVAPLQHPEGPRIVCETLASGPPGIETQAHVDGITEKMLDWWKHHPQRQQATGLVIACFSDPGLHAMREELSIPVIGCAEAAYHTAASLGGPFGVISILSRSVPRHLRQIRLLGMEHLLAADLPIEVSVVDLGDEALTFGRMRSVGECLVRQHGARVVVMGCAGMARYRRRLEDTLGVPVVDPTQAGVAMMMGRLRIAALP